MILHSIRRLESQRYEVEFRQDAQHRVFTIAVERVRDIETVTWEPEFGTLIMRGTPHLTPLFEAILAMHRAESVGAQLRWDDVEVER